MILPILAIRGEPGLSQTLAQAAVEQIEIVGIPIFEVNPVDWQLPDQLDFDGLLIGSANAIRHGGVLLESLKHLPVFAVGAQTALAAKKAGFSVPHVGQGGLQSVLDSPEARSKRFLRLSGAERVPLIVRDAQEIAEICVYDNMAIPAPSRLGELLLNGGIVLLHSAAAILHFTNECNRMDIDKRLITLAALGPRITERAGAGWAAIHTAETPTDAGLLALVKNICQ